MKVKLFFSLVFIMTCGVVFGQARYNVKLKSNFNEFASNDGCDSYYNADFKTMGGTVLHIGKWKPNYGTVQADSVSISINDATKSFEVSGQNQSRSTDWKGNHSCDGGGWTNGFSDLFNKYQQTSYWTKSYGIPNWWTSQVTVTYYPDNLAIQSVSSFQYNTKWVLTPNDVTTLNATAGFPSDAYTWKYQLPGSTNWINLPAAYQGKSTISFTGNELLNTSFNNQVGYKVLVSVWAKGSDGVPKIYGNTVELLPKFVAPKIISITPQVAKCSNSTTSSVKIKLDKPFDADATYMKLLNLKSGITSGPTLQLAATNFDAATNTYEWINLDVNTTYHISINAYLYQAPGDLTAQSLEATYYIDRTDYYYTLNLFPPVLQASIIKNGIYCNGGQDASLDGKVQGGTPPYNLSYTNKTTGAVLSSHSLANPYPIQYVLDIGGAKNLSLGDYRLIVQDKNACAAQSEITITQPVTALSKVSEEITDVSGYGLNNGVFKIKLKGGTYSNPNGYNLPQLKTGTTAHTGQLINSSNNEFTFAFYNLPPGDYNFRAADLNMISYASSIKDSAGCLVKETLTIRQPPPLLLNLEQTQTIVCNGDATASLTGHATGGKRFATEKPYTYTWSYSLNGAGATYTLLTVSDSVLNQRVAGFYKLQVKDQNNNTMTKIIEVVQPQKVDYTVTVKNVTCLNWTDGALAVSAINGGTAPYTVTWPDQSHALQISDLAQGYYLVKVSDALNCIVSRNVKVKDTLNDITIEQGSYKLPHCYGEGNGSMGVKVTVGSMPYTVLWNNGSTDTLLSAIKAGTYTIQILNSNNCLKEVSFTLLNPNQIPLDLDADRYLCIGQTAAYDIEVKDSLYQYQWQGPELNTTATKVNLTLPGTYSATINDSHGCARTESVTVHRVESVIASDFVVSSQVFAGDQVSLVNITQDRFTDSCTWNFASNPNIEVISSSYEYATLIFKEKGIYKIGLKSQLGNCVKVMEKEIVVVEPTFDHKPYNGATSFIRDFEVMPNPNDGNFEVQIRMEDIASVKLRLLDFYSKSDIKEFEYYDQKDYSIPMHLDVAPGTYILFLETPYGTRITKVIIMQ